QPDTTAHIAQSYFAYGNAAPAGARVAVGDVTHDGRADVLVASGPGGPALVKAFDGPSGRELWAFSPYGGFRGGVFIAAADVDHDGYADAVLGTGAGAGAHVVVYSGRTGQVIASFLPFGGFTGGVAVAAADVNRDGYADVITAAGPGG